MPTIIDVAKLAGVSRATVSRVINNHPYVEEEKKKRVFKAMDQLGYEPSQIAKQLRSNKTHMIAVIVPRIANLFFAELVNGMEMISSEKKYHIILCQTRHNKEEEAEFLQLLSRKQVDGIIMASVTHTYEELLHYTKRGPIVFCSDYCHSNLPTIKVDHEEGAYKATRHLLELGHRRIACSLTRISSLTNEREAGYRKAMTEYGCLIEDSWIMKNRISFDDGRLVAHDLYRMEDRVSAIFVGSDEVAVGVIKETKKLGLKVPQDLSVIGFDNLKISEIIEPNLTTVAQPVIELGKKSMELIIQLIENNDSVTDRNYLLPTQLIIRESTGPKK